MPRPKPYDWYSDKLAREHRCTRCGWHRHYSDNPRWMTRNTITDHTTGETTTPIELARRDIERHNCAAHEQALQRLHNRLHMRPHDNGAGRVRTATAGQNDRRMFNYGTD